MGPFVLGVLVGWLAEWMFYTFWVKEGQNSDDCSSLKAELEAKNRQIESLRTQLDASSGTSKALTKTSAIAAKSNKTVDTKSTSKKPSAAKKPAAAKTTVTATPNKSAKSSTGTQSANKKVKAVGDDFTKLSGIGPSMAATLKSLGIDTFTKLAETDDDILRDMLEESGARMNNNKEAMDSWNEQAQVAAKGDFAALKKMQEELKN